MQQLPPALAGLAKYSQFILWKAVYDSVKEKWDKYPVNARTGQVCDAHDPNTWVDAATAIQKSAEFNLEVGFVFTERDPLFFIDIDKCLLPSGQWSDIAVSLCQQFPGCAVEVSHSGTGLHIIGTAAKIPHGCKNVKLGLELYTEGRFIALTGNQAVGSVDECPTGGLVQVVETYFPPSPATAEDLDWTTEPAPEWSGPLDDDELIEKMLNSKPSGAAVFGSRASVQDLWNANDDVLGRIWPDEFGNRTFDNSFADAALCSHLAFWTGKDCERMDRLFRRSGLFRDKWADRPDYGPRTILFAAGHCQSVYGSKKSTAPVNHEPVQPTPPKYTGGDPELRTGFQFLAITQQIELFKGCVYIRDLHRVYTPDGGLLKPETFKATYGGYEFAIDSGNEKTTKNAWEVFTESQAARFPRAHGICFRPEIPPGALVHEEDRVLVNTYVPITIKREKGDPSPFMNHLNKMLPDERDRTILLSYMAACVQFPGVKFQWAPLLQGVEGNGKTLMISAVAAALGHRYTHLPNASDLGGNGQKFNAWLQNKLLIGIEEIYVSDRREVWEALKPLITNTRIEFQGKGSDQITGDNRANFIMCSNHKDAILKTRNDRRCAPFFTQQQNDQDLIRDGMTGEYFPKLWNWAKSGGFAIVADYLLSYKIPDNFNPATLCHRAPETTSTNEALAVSLGGVEQEILEAVDEHRPGFSKGWISSMALDKMLHNRRDNKRIPPNKRRELMYLLGYILHPGLKDGRTNNAIMQEGGKPRLYIRRDHLYVNLNIGSEIVRHYCEDQGYTPGTTGDIKATVAS